jgi:molecular chaperone GrpE (heat shock protein)
VAWLDRLFSGRRQPDRGDGRDAGALDPAATADPRLARDEELLEATHRLARAQARQGARLEEMEGKLEAGFQDLRAVVGTLAAPAATDQLRWDDLLDAMDALEEAVALAGSVPELAQGLRQVLHRLERFAAQAEISRKRPVGSAPDGRLFRVVGTEEAPAVAEGAVARVVRAAVLRGTRVLREGEVIINRRSA